MSIEISISLSVYLSIYLIYLDVYVCMLVSKYVYTYVCMYVLYIYVCARALVVREQRGSRHGQHCARTLPRVCASRASRKLAAPRPFRLRPPLVRRVLA
jgi:hypothetical protein